MTKEESLKIDLKANLKAYIKCRFPEKEEDFIENMANYIIEQIDENDNLAYDVETWLEDSDESENYYD